MGTGAFLFPFGTTQGILSCDNLITPEGLPVTSRYFFINDTSVSFLFLGNTGTGSREFKEFFSEWLLSEFCENNEIEINEVIKNISSFIAQFSGTKISKNKLNNQPLKEKLRLDKYLWSIRLFKTRTLAAAACDTGKVKHQGSSVKASKNVGTGDEYEIKTDAGKKLIKVTGLLHNRVAYSEAVKYYLDITPQEEKDKMLFQAASFHTGKRKSKIGRPTKKQRRELDDFLGEEEE